LLRNILKANTISSDESWSAYPKAWQDNLLQCFRDGDFQNVSALVNFVVAASLPEEGIKLFNLPCLSGDRAHDHAKVLSGTLLKQGDLKDSLMTQAAFFLDCPLTDVINLRCLMRTLTDVLDILKEHRIPVEWLGISRLQEHFTFVRKQITLCASDSDALAGCLEPSMGYVTRVLGSVTDVRELADDATEWKAFIRCLDMYLLTVTSDYWNRMTEAKAFVEDLLTVPTAPIRHLLLTKKM
jgi:hypothetical protein